MEATKYTQQKEHTQQPWHKDDELKKNNILVELKIMCL